MSEAELQEAVAGYLVTEYPHVLFHSDFGSGVKLTPAQAKRQKRQNGYRRGWPDLEIAEPRMSPVTCHRKAPPLEWKHGLYIELKKEGTRLKKKNGEWVTEHIAEQAKVRDQLRQRGYCAEFAVGFEEAKRIIDEYLGGK